MKILGIILVMLILAFGCTSQSPPVVNTTNHTDANGCVAGTQWCPAKNKCITPSENCATACTMEAKICPDGTAVGRIGPNCEFAPCPVVNSTNLTNAEVRQIAQTVCGNVGTLHSEITYNPNSHTYWIDINASRPGCSPACVVYENRSAEVNWRCTGAIPPNYTVTTANNDLGVILVGRNGRTLYTFADDSVNRTTCYADCASHWPPLLINDTVRVPASLTGDFGVIRRVDSSIQVTYNGWPLYYYYEDHASGDTNGQGVGGKWYVVHPE